MVYSFGGYRIDTALFQVSCDGAPIRVEPQVIEVLVFLIENRDRVVSRDELLDKVWKDRIVSDSTLSSRIKSARHAIGDDGVRQDCIKTVHGRGFRFVADVETEHTVSATKPEWPPVPAEISRPATRYARSGDVHIAYHVFGDGPVSVILMPGFVSHIDNYWDQPDLKRFLCQMGAKVRMAMFDKRGTGMSDKVDALPGMDERMDDVRAVMDAVGFDTAFVMGVSEGGSLAALFAAYNPDRCDGLILYGSFAQFKHWVPDEAALQEFFNYIETDWGSGKSVPQFAPSVADDPEFVHWWSKFERLGGTPGATIALMKMNSRIDISHVLPSINVPTLVIHRTGDVLIDIEAGRQLANEIPDAQYVEFPGLDHFPFVGSNRDRITEAILNFLESPTRRRPPNRVLATLVLVQYNSKLASPGVDLVEEAAFQECVAQYHPNRVSHRTNGFAATFDGPSRGLEYAHAVSVMLRRKAVDHCVGVHTGEVELEGDSISGIAMDITEDIADCAGDNEVLVSRTVNDLVAGSTVELRQRGVFHLPSIKKQWQLYELVGQNV